MKRFHCFWVSSSQAAKSSLSVTDWSRFKADDVLAEVLATCTTKQQCLSADETTAKLLKRPSVNERCCVLHLAERRVQSGQHVQANIMQTDDTAQQETLQSRHGRSVNLQKADV